MKLEAGQKMIDAIASQLSEHFDAVQILVSFPSEGGTQGLQSGRGNWYARQGMAREFTNRDNAYEIALALKRQDSE